MGVGVGSCVCDKVRLVADEVVGVGELACADLRGDDFPAFVAGKGYGELGILLVVLLALRLCRLSVFAHTTTSSANRRVLH